MKSITIKDKKGLILIKVIKTDDSASLIRDNRFSDMFISILMNDGQIIKINPASPGEARA